LPRVADRKHTAEDLLQAFVLAPEGVRLHLEEVAEALQLDLEQVGNAQIPLAVDLGEALPIFPACSLQRVPPFSMTKHELIAPSGAAMSRSGGRRPRAGGTAGSTPLWPRSGRTERRPADGLLDLDGRALLLELGLHLRGFRLGHLLLDRLGRAVHQVLGFLEAEAGQL